MDISLDVKTQNDILNICHAYKEIKKTDDIISTPVGYNYLVFITIGLDGNMTTFESHNLADSQLAVEPDRCCLPRFHD